RLVGSAKDQQAGLADAKTGRSSDRLAQENAFALLRHDGFQRATIWSVISSRHERRSPVFVNFVRSTWISNWREVVPGPGLVVSMLDCFWPRLMPYKTVAMRLLRKRAPPVA